MKKKYKATGFTRLLLFMIIFAPIVYVGASYYNGEDGIENIKNILNIDQTTAQKIEDKRKVINNYKVKIEALESEIKKLQQGH